MESLIESIYTAFINDYHKYIMIIDPDRCKGLLEHLSKYAHPYRIVIDIDTMEEPILLESSVMFPTTKVIYIRGRIDEEVEGIIDACSPLVLTV